MNKPQSAREAAFGVLHAVCRSNAYSNLSYGPLADLSEPDKALARTIVKGVLEKQRLLDKLLEPTVRKEPEKDVRILLRIGLYQILFLDRVPDSAACNETVQLAKARFGRPRADFVNAVLRAAVRDKEHLFRII
ncbi:MAG: 16S rRNA (cytosine(967)-C(5))-methyltransferase RsmB, partial [Clostridia bacterium]|nr:16S rRNA (cytosine(967)-C(5))-methyltransferase RsmB [Clostridia bacterium]